MYYGILALGSNGSGQLGIGHQGDVSKPIECLFDPGSDYDRSWEPKKLVAGGNHTLILFDNGAVFAAGLNTDGRCGLASQDDPLEIFHRSFFASQEGHTIDRFKDIAATWEASVFVTHDDHVYTAGSGSKGELGHGAECTRLAWPQVLPGFPPVPASIRSITACMSHVVAVLTTGQAYGWGSGRKGQLGEPSARIAKPRAIATAEEKWHQVACGRDFTCLFAVNYGDDFLMLGDDKWGIRDPQQTKKEPVTLPLTPHRVVTASWSSIFMLLGHGQIVNRGRNDHGQLVPEDYPCLDRIAAGSEHVIGDVDNRVLAWGWGEHGNCGEKTDRNGDVRTCNGLGEGRVLGAGCATSFIVRQKTP